MILPLAGAAMIVAALMPIEAEAQLLPSFGRDRAGTSGYQFLKIPVDARSASMSQTVASNASDVSSLFWNPAMAAQIDHKRNAPCRRQCGQFGLWDRLGETLYLIITGVDL